MIKWDNKYSVGISMIDEEHKKIIDIINNLPIHSNIIDKKIYQGYYW